jgi:hypothetical protein
MSLRQQLTNSLNQHYPLSGQSIELFAQDRGVEVLADLSGIEQMSVAIDKLTLSVAKLADASVAQLQTTTDELCKRVNYLLEPIRPYETDAEQCSVQLRSSPPQKDENGATYYEILVKKGGRITLSRFQKTRGNDRETIPAMVTREVFLRLVDDMANVVG